MRMGSRLDRRLGSSLLPVFVAIAISNAPAYAARASFPVFTDFTGLRMIDAKVIASVGPPQPQRIAYRYDLRFATAGGPARRTLEYVLGIDDAGYRRVESGDSLAAVDGPSAMLWMDSRLVAVSDSASDLQFDGREPATGRTWRWNLDLGSQPIHRLLLEVRCDAAIPLDGIDNNLHLLTHRATDWPGFTSPLELTVHFEPAVGREAIGGGLPEGSVYERGRLTFRIPGRSSRAPLDQTPLNEVSFFWSDGSAILLDRHVVAASDPYYEHTVYPVDWVEGCCLEGEREADLQQRIREIARGAADDTLSGEMRELVGQLRRGAADAVAELTGYRDALALSGAHARTGDPDDVLNPVARRNLRLCRALVLAYDVRKRPSEITALEREAVARFGDIPGEPAASGR